MSEDYVHPIHIACVGGTYVFIPYNDVIESLQLALKNNATEKPAAGTYGLRSAQLQTIFDSFYTSTISSYSTKIQMYFAFRFLALGTIEEKRIGSMVIAKNLDELTIEYVNDFERVFDTNITEWTTCDGFSMRVLAPLIKKSDEFAERISQWKDCGKVWRMRASCVTFVALAKVGAMTDLSFEICGSCVKSSERFVQLGVGCLLREMSLMFPDKVVTFITENYRFFSREGLRYSIDKLNAVTRKQILGMGKKRNTKTQNQQHSIPQQQQQQTQQQQQQTQPQQSVQLQNQIPIQRIQPQQQYQMVQPMYVDMMAYYEDENQMYDLQMQQGNPQMMQQMNPQMMGQMNPQMMGQMMGQMNGMQQINSGMVSQTNKNPNGSHPSNA
ncbi:Uncharacterized protein QTN25_010797 [Entamoeba marina]